MSTIIQYLTTIHFGAGAVRQIPSLLTQLAIQRPLLVTDHGLIQSGLTDRLAMDTAAVFADVYSNPDEASVLRGLACYREHDCDGIVAFGGGSPIDCAKCIGLLVTHPEPLGQYALIRDGLGKIVANKPPLIAVPTTAGTGSEVGRAALITLHSGEKLAIVSPHLIPTLAICDPELTLDLPPRLTAATGLDAISHCIETYCSPRENPVAEAIALDGLARAVGSLRQAVEDGQSILHRHEMMMASLEGGLTFQKGLGLIHSLSHPLGGLREKRLHHGMLNAIFLPHVVRLNAPSCPAKMRRIAATVGIANPAELPEFFARLVHDVGLPARLSELGVEQTDLTDIADAAMRDHSTPTNPRPLTATDCATVLRAAL